MSLSIAAGLAWAVPVKPDKLGDHLDRFKATFPILQALRLCHRFGRGEKVYVTKLPLEIEQAIEELIVKAWDSFDFDNWVELGTWEEQFDCFQNQCSIMSHLPDSNSPLSDQTSDDFEDCKACEEHYRYGAEHCLNVCKPDAADPCLECDKGSSIGKPWECLKSCDSRKSTVKNMVALDWDWLGAHWAAQNAWRARITQTGKGGFMLRKHFGLKALFVNVRKGRGADEPWPQTQYQFLHGDEPQETTICYLILPDTELAEKKCEISEMEADNSFGLMRAGRAMSVTLAGAAELSLKQQRFQRALRILGLKPWIHPCMDVNKRTVTGLADIIKEDKKRWHKVSTYYDDKATWPRLLLLGTASAHTAG